MRKQRKRQIAGIMAAVFMLSGINTSVFADVITEMPEGNIESTWRAEVESPSDAGRDIIKRLTSSNADKVVVEKATANNAVMFAAAGEKIENDVIQIIQNGNVQELTLNGSTCSGTGYTIEKTEGNIYTLQLNDFSGDSIRIGKGIWTIELSGTSIVQVKGNELTYGAVDIRGDGTEVTVSGTGKLAVYGYRTGILIDNAGTVKMESGEVEAHASESAYNVGIKVNQSSRLEVAGGKITGDCGRGFAMYNAGEMEISGGEVIAKGTGNGMELGINAKLTVRGGQLTAIGGSSRSGIDAEYEGGQIRIEDKGRVEAYGSKGIFLGNAKNVSLIISGDEAYFEGTFQSGWNSTTTVEAGGTLKSSYIFNGGEFHLKEGGKLILDGEYENDTPYWSKFCKEGGTISGPGSFKEGSKIKVNVYCIKSSGYFEMGDSTSLDGYFRVETDGQLSEIGPLTYVIDNTGIDNPGSAEIDKDHNIHFTGVGKIRIRCKVEETKYYSGAESTVTLDVNPYFLGNRTTVAAYSGVYDGASHPAVTVQVDGKDPGELGLTVKYAENKKEGGFGEYTTVCPEVKDTSDNSRYFRVQLSGENYTTCTKDSGKVSITPKPASEQDGWSIEIKETDFIYNRSPQEPEIVVKRGDHTLEEGTDYNIVYYYKIVPQGVESCAKPINVGKYYVGVTLRKNYSGYIYSNENPAEGQSGTFEIHPQTLTAKIASNSLQYMKKTYDGTPNGTANMRDRLQIELYAGTEKLTFVSADKSEVHFLFSDADAGKNKKLQVIGIKLNGYTDNYVFSGIAETDEAEITPGNLQECELKADLLEYTGEPQKPAVKYTVIGCNADIINKFDVTYATAKYGDYKEEIPSFTTPGTYYVYYKLSAKNYETENKYFSVIVMPADLNGAEIRLKKTNLVYTGESLKPDVKVVYKGHILPETSYNISYEKTDDAGTSSERMDGAKDAGSYKVWVTGGTGYTINEKAADQKFAITPKPLDDTIAVTFQPENTVYDTASHQPKIIVKDLVTGAELVENVEYTAEYLGDWKDSGKHVLRLTGAGENGKGNYKGTLDVDYEITKADLSQASVTVNGSYTYEAAEQRPSKDQVEVKLDGRVVDPDEYELSYQDNISAGTDAKVIVTAKANGNYMNQAEGSFTIKPAVLKISGAVLKKKVYDGQKNGEVESLIFEGLKGSDRLLPEGQDYEASAEFTDVNAGNGKSVQIAGKLKSTESTKNYILEGDTFLLEGQTIEKAPAPELEGQQILMPYDTKGEQQIKLAILPEDCGTVYDAKASILPKHADVQIVDSVRMDGTTVILTLRDNRRWMIGESAVIAVEGIRTTNYEDMSGMIELVLTDRAYQESWDSDDSDSGNQDKKVSSNVKNPRGWLLDGKGWRLRFPNGTYAKGSIAGTDASGNRLVKYHWEMVNDRWYAFDENGYLKTGLFHDAGYMGTFFVDENLGMHTGWKLIDGKWYYFKAMSDGTKGIMLRSQRTPDGYYVNENGEWDGK